MDDPPPRTVDDLDGLLAFRDATRRANAFKLQRIALDEQDEWGLRDGVLSHQTRGFFHVAGAVCRETGAERLVLHQPQAAITCLALERNDVSPRVLLHARAEPGNCDEVQYGPTIQSTPANFMRLHGGRAPLHLELFLDCAPDAAIPLGQSSQLDLSLRYFQKIKTVMYVEARTTLSTGHDLVWAPLRVVADALLCDHLLNIDLRAMLACFDWDGWLGAHRRVDAAQPPPVPAPGVSVPASRPWRLARLDELTGWRVGAFGVEPESDRSTGVRMIRAVCRGRERGEWAQPLFDAPGIGDVTLFTRRGHGGEPEYLLRRIADPGLAGGSAWTTSIDRAAEIPCDDPIGGRVLRSMLLSEEGGRFLHCVNRYRVVAADAGIRPHADQAWVGVETLRHVLRSSNAATIHLRCAASLILDQLHPQTFGGSIGGSASWADAVNRSP